METSVKRAISERVKKLRSELNLTQKQLAQSTGLSYRSIVDYENAYREPNSKAMAALERFFGVSGEYLRGETDTPQPVRDDEFREDMSTIQKELQPAFNNLVASLEDGADLEQKAIFSILVELRHVLTISQLTPDQRQDAMQQLQQAVAVTTRYIDKGEGADELAEQNIIKKYRLLDQRGQAAVLDTLQREYDYLFKTIEVPMAARGGGKHTIRTTQADEDQMKEKLAQTRPPEDL